VIAIGTALVDAPIPMRRLQCPIVGEARGHGKLRAPVYDAAAIPGPAMALNQPTLCPSTNAVSPLGLWILLWRYSRLGAKWSAVRKLTGWVVVGTRGGCELANTVWLSAACAG
jgi:hypothetical protein